MVAMNCRKSNTEIVYSKLVRRAILSFVGVATKQAEDIELNGEHNFMLETELADVRNIANGSKDFIKKLADDALQTMNIIKVLQMEIQVQRRTILE